MEKHPKFLWLQSICDDKCEIGTLHSAVATYQNLADEKKWFAVELYFDESLVRPYLVVKYDGQSLNRVVLPMFAEESLSPKEIHNVFNSLQPPGDPDTYEDGLILALVSSDHTIVYHSMCPGLVPPTVKPTAPIPRSRDLKRKGPSQNDEQDTRGEEK